MISLSILAPRTSNVYCSFNFLSLASNLARYWLLDVRWADLLRPGNFVNQFSSLNGSLRLKISITLSFIGLC